MRKLLLSGSAVALLLGAASAQADYVDPLVVTVDDHSYVTYTAPLVLTPGVHLLQAPGLRMANCRRPGALPLAFGASRLLYAALDQSVDGRSLRIEFHPTRVVLETEHRDVVCDGAALTGESGVDRVFRSNLER